MHVVHCLVYRTDKDGNRYKSLQPFEIYKGQRRPIDPKTKFATTPFKEKFKSRKDKDE